MTLKTLEGWWKQLHLQKALHWAYCTDGQMVLGCAHLAMQLPTGILVKSVYDASHATMMRRAARPACRCWLLSQARLVFLGLTPWALARFPVTPPPPKRKSGSVPWPPAAGPATCACQGEPGHSTGCAREGGSSWLPAQGMMSVPFGPDPGFSTSPFTRGRPRWCNSEAPSLAWDLFTRLCAVKGRGSLLFLTLWIHHTHTNDANETDLHLICISKQAAARHWELLGGGAKPLSPLPPHSHPTLLASGMERAKSLCTFSSLPESHED